MGTAWWRCVHGIQPAAQCSECEVAVPLRFDLQRQALLSDSAEARAGRSGVEGPELPGHASLSLGAVTAAYEREQKARLYKEWFTPNPLLKLLVQNAEANRNDPVVPMEKDDQTLCIENECLARSLEAVTARIAELEDDVARLKLHLEAAEAELSAARKVGVPRETPFDAVEFPVNALKWSV